MTATVYADAGAERRTFRRFRFEDGRNRAAPMVYPNQLTDTVGLEFEYLYADTGASCDAMKRKVFSFSRRTSWVPERLLC